MPAPTDTRLPTKPEVQRANTLARLADQIGAELKAAREAAMTSLQHAIKAGELLIQAKAAIGHGNYEHWLRTNLGISKQTAAGYVRLFKNRDQIEDGMPLRDALKAIAEPRAPRLGAPAVTAADLATAKRQISAATKQLTTPNVQHVVPLAGDGQKAKPAPTPDPEAPVDHLALWAETDDDEHLARYLWELVGAHRCFDLTVLWRAWLHEGEDTAPAPAAAPEPPRAAPKAAKPAPADAAAADAAALGEAIKAALAGGMTEAELLFQAQVGARKGYPISAGHIADLAQGRNSPGNYHIRHAIWAALGGRPAAT